MKPVRWLSLGLTVSLWGCSTTSSHNAAIFNPQAPRMNSVFYEGATGSTRARAIVSNNPAPGDTVLRGYTRDASNEINNLFPVTPNPELVMYVFPHLTPNGVPVPGFATTLKLYENNHYLLPGELQ